MEAELVTELPTATGSTSRSGTASAACSRTPSGELALWSRNGRPLLRYFPELRPLGELLPPHSALDGEIVIARDGVARLRRDADAPPSGREPRSAGCRPRSRPSYVAFDVLLWKGEPVHEQPLEKRRAELERIAKRFQLSPATRDRRSRRATWLDRFEAAGLDGVIAKRLGVAVPARARATASSR